MLRVVVQNMLVDFVGDAVSVPPDAEVAYEFEFRSREYFAGRIVRRVQDDCFGVRAKRGREFLFVKGPIGSAQLDEPRRGPA